MTATRADLEEIGLTIERMWRQGAPRQVAEMEARGSFYDHILSLQGIYERSYADLIAQNRPHDQVTETVNALVAPPLDWQPE
jgi:hypothetical protein